MNLSLKRSLEQADSLNDIINLNNIDDILFSNIYFLSLNKPDAFEKLIELNKLGFFTTEYQLSEIEQIGNTIGRQRSYLNCWCSKSILSKYIGKFTKSICEKRYIIQVFYQNSVQGNLTYCPERINLTEIEYLNGRVETIEEFKRTNKQAKLNEITNLKIREVLSDIQYVYISIIAKNFEDNSLDMFLEIEKQKISNYRLSYLPSQKCLINNSINDEDNSIIDVNYYPKNVIKLEINDIIIYDNFAYRILEIDQLGNNKYSKKRNKLVCENIYSKKISEIIIGKNIGSIKILIN